MYSSSNGFQGGSGRSSLLIERADQAITFNPLGNAKFGDGSIALSASSSSGLAVTYSIVSGPGYINDGNLYITGAGSIVVAADQAGDVNYKPASSVQQTLTVTAEATTTAVSSSKSSSTHGDVVTVTATVAAIGDSVVGAVQFLIDGMTFGSPVTLTAGSASVTLPFTLSAGSHTISATYLGTSDFETSTSSGVTQRVAQAQAAISVTGYTATYDGTAHTATGSAVGVDGSLLSGLTLSGTTHTNAGTTTDTWTFHDPSGNYADASGTVVNVIAQANASISIIGYLSTYDATTHTATGSATGVGGIDLTGGLNLTGTSHRNAGVYLGDTWSFHDASGNYADASGTVNETIQVATALITVTGYNTTYDTFLHTAIGSATGVGSIDLSGSLTLSGTSHTNAGIYDGDTWTFHDPSGNYQDATGTVNDVIGQAQASINVTPYQTTYDARLHTAVGSATGVGGVDLSSGLTLTGTTHRNAGIYSADSWTFHDASGNYADASGVVTDQIGKARAVIQITPYTSVGTKFDGTTRTAQGTASGVSGIDLSFGLNLAGTAHVNAGNYTNDTWTFTGGRNYYDASGFITDSIGQATAMISVTGYTTAYDAKPHTATGTATGLGGIDLSSGLNLSQTTHTNAGNYTGDTWTFHDPSGNYADASGTVNSVISSSLATATIIVTPYTTTYDAKVHTATGSVTGIGGIDLSRYLTLTGTAHIGAGSYRDSWTFHDPSGNYADSSGTVVNTIGQANASIIVSGYNTTYDGALHTASGTATGIDAVDLSSGLVLTGTSHSDAGTYTADSWSFHDPAGNYADAIGTVNNFIGQASATISVTGYSVTYDGNPHTATGSAAGVGGVNLNLDLDLSGTIHRDPGIYNGDRWSFHDPAGNYLDATGTVDDLISSVPVITTQPVSRSVSSGVTTSFTAAGSGTPAPTVQWQTSTDNGATWNNIPGATSTTYTLTPVATNNSNQYRASFTNIAGTTFTDPATLTVYTAPVVTRQPTNTSVVAGGTVTLTATATGTPVPTVQWQQSTNDGSTWTYIPGATSSTYSFTGSLAVNGNQFRAVFTNVAGATSTNTAILTVTQPFKVLTSYNLTSFVGLSTGSFNLVDFQDPQAVTSPTTYKATINWGDGQTDTNVPVSHSIADGTTVHVFGSHTYAAGGTYHPIVTLTDAGGSSISSTLANTATIRVGNDVSSRVSVTRSGAIKDRVTGLYYSTVTITNISGTALTGDIDLILTNLTSGVTLTNATGFTTGGAVPWIRFSTTGLAAGKSISLSLGFALSSGVTSFNYSFKVDSLI